MSIETATVDPKAAAPAAPRLQRYPRQQQGGDARLLGLADAYMGFATTEPGPWATPFEARLRPALPAKRDRQAIKREPGR